MPPRRPTACGSIGHPRPLRYPAMGLTERTRCPGRSPSSPSWAAPARRHPLARRRATRAASGRPSPRTDRRVAQPRLESVVHALPGVRARARTGAGAHAPEGHGHARRDCESPRRSRTRAARGLAARGSGTDRGRRDHRSGRARPAEALDRARARAPKSGGSALGRALGHRSHAARHSRKFWRLEHLRMRERLARRHGDGVDVEHREQRAHALEPLVARDLVSTHPAVEALVIVAVGERLVLRRRRLGREARQPRTALGSRNRPNPS